MSWMYRIIAIGLLFVYSLLLGHEMIPHVHGELSHDEALNFQHEHEHHFHAALAQDEHHYFAHANHFDQSFFDFLSCLLSDSDHPDLEDDGQPSSRPSEKPTLSKLSVAQLLIASWMSADRVEAANQDYPAIADAEAVRSALFFKQLPQRGPPRIS